MEITALEGDGEMKQDVICVGQAVIDCITRGQETEPYKENVYRAEQIRLSTGGDAVNEAFNLALMGHSVRLVCGVGEDLAGDILLSEARRRGVDTSAMRRTPGLTTPVANLMVRRDGSRHSINSAATMLEGYLPSPHELEGGRIVSFASLFRAPLDRAETVRQLIRAAGRTGAIVCCDTKLPTYRNITLEDLKEVLPLVDYIFPNEKEAAWHVRASGGGPGRRAAALAGDAGRGGLQAAERDFAAMASVFHDYGIQNVIIKAGPAGCYASLRDGTWMLPPLPVNVVDTTGGGDAFVSGFLSGLLSGKPQRECLDLALGRAAQCISHMGAVE